MHHSSPQGYELYDCCDIKKGLSDSEDESTLHGSSLKVIRDPLTVDNYNHKFSELLKYEELTHAKILKERYAKLKQ